MLFYLYAPGKSLKIIDFIIVLKFREIKITKQKLCGVNHIRN
jgi:hypothetical protein